MEIFSKVLVENHELADAERGEQERNGEAGGVDGEEEEAAGNGVAGGGERENGGEDRADARRPAEGEREAQEEAAPDARLRGAAAEVDIAIQPAGHRRAEKADKREREKMRSAQSSEERGVAEIGRNAESDEDHAKDNSPAQIEFDQPADETNAEEKDQGSSDRGEKRAILAKERANCAGRGAERNKNEGKT